MKPPATLPVADGKNNPRYGTSVPSSTAAAPAKEPALGHYVVPVTSGQKKANNNHAPTKQSVNDNRDGHRPAPMDVDADATKT